MPRSARARPTPPAIGGSAIGAAVPFDGNYTDDIVSWMFWNEDWLEENVPDMLSQLMVFTEMGHLAWVVFPYPGFRL